MRPNDVQDAARGRPETFDFLGFTHKCAKTRKQGWFTIHRTVDRQTHACDTPGDQDRSCANGCTGHWAKRPGGCGVLCRAG